MQKFKDEIDRTLQQRLECRVICSNCSHSIIFGVKTKECICSHCKNKVKNTSKARFRYELINAKRKIEKED